MRPVHVDNLAATVSQTRLLLLDFDGPVCDIFAGYPAPRIARELQDLIAAQGQPIVPALANEPDPLQVLRVVARLYPDHLTLTVAEAFRTAELAAVKTAQPTPGAADVIDAAKATGRQLSIVSNNSREAVIAYLDAHGLTRIFDRVVGRYEGMNPALLKPSRHLVDLATIDLDAPPQATALVGDSVSDIEAAQAAGIESIGYANKFGKDRAFADAGATNVIATMTELAAALRETPNGQE